MTLSAFDQNPRNTGKTKTGTTTSAYAEAINLYNGMGAVVLLISTGQTMFYKIDAYLSEDGLAIPVKTETTTVSSTQLIDTSMNFPFYRMVVSVKQNSAASAYQVDAVKY
jgi:hypothetical protein